MVTTRTAQSLFPFSAHYHGGHHLDLSRTGLKDKDIPHLLRFLKSKPYITSLDISHNQITSAAANLFAYNTTLTNINFFFNHIDRNNIDFLTKAIRRNYLLQLRLKRKSWWDKFITFLLIGSEASNIGIVIDMVSQWYKPILSMLGGIFGSLVFYADPLIYCFKSAVRLTKIAGRTLFGITFEEEKNGTHKYQTLADVTSLGLFSLAIVVFLGLIVAPPVGITVAWGLALTGLTITGHFEYAHQEKLAKEKYERMVADHAPPEAIKHAKEDYLAKRNSKRLFYGLLVGLTLLLLCGSAAVFAPPALAPILYIVSKVASAYLGGIAVCRFSNWAFPKTVNKITGFLNGIKNWFFPQKKHYTESPTVSPAPSVRIHREIELKEEKHDPYITADRASDYQRLPDAPPAVPLALLSDVKHVGHKTVDRTLTDCKAIHFNAYSHRATDDDCLQEKIEKPSLRRSLSF